MNRSERYAERCREMKNRILMQNRANKKRLQNRLKQREKEEKEKRELFQKQKSRLSKEEKRKAEGNDQTDDEEVLSNTVKNKTKTVTTKKVEKTAKSTIEKTAVPRLTRARLAAAGVDNIVPKTEKISVQEETTGVTCLINIGSPSDDNLSSSDDEDKRAPSVSTVVPKKVHSPEPLIVSQDQIATEESIKTNAKVLPERDEFESFSSDSEDDSDDYENEIGNIKRVFRCSTDVEESLTDDSEDISDDDDLELGSPYKPFFYQFQKPPITTETEPTTVPVNEESSSTFRCKECLRIFKSKQNWKAHEQAHSSTPEVCCSQCRLEIHHKTNFNLHVYHCVQNFESNYSTYLKEKKYPEYFKAVEESSKDLSVPLPKFEDFSMNFKMDKKGMVTGLDPTLATYDINYRMANHDDDSEDSDE
uniref:C2H2-type domain-containing protein n=1 Tax=Caenorhabditis tropicalis TaxID=1561998 RepID=A0A1I7TLG1_9PELO